MSGDINPIHRIIEENFERAGFEVMRLRIEHGIAHAECFHLKALIDMWEARTPPEQMQQPVNSASEDDQSVPATDA